MQIVTTIFLSRASVIFFRVNIENVLFLTDGGREGQLPHFGGL